jgi:UDP-glucose:(heptosyl)LPS alpha-1,3-glucosyltransferase
MRITHIYPFIHRRGGIERYVVDLVHQQGPTNEITLVAAEVDFAQLPIGKKINWIATPCIRTPAFLTAISFCISHWLNRRKIAADITNAHGASAFASDVVTAHSVHKAWFFRSRSSLRLFSREWWLKHLNPMHYLTIAIEAWQYRPGGCRRIIAISDAVKDELIRFHHVDVSRIRVVHSGVNLEMFAPGRYESERLRRRQQFGIQPNGLALLFVANEFRRKGLQTILDALAQLKQPSVHLLIIGGDASESFERYAESIGLVDQVHFLGRSSEVPQWMGASDLFVFPTLYEPFGLVITEAMASSLPVITSRRAGAAELIEHGVDGYLLDDPSDVSELLTAIKKLHAPEVRAAIGRAARKKAEQYGFDRCARETEAVYRELLES